MCYSDSHVQRKNGLCHTVTRAVQVGYIVIGHRSYRKIFMSNALNKQEVVFITKLLLEN